MPLSDVCTVLPAVATLMVPPLMMGVPVIEIPPSVLTCVILAATVECAADGKWGNEYLCIAPRNCTCDCVDDDGAICIAFDLVAVVFCAIKCIVFR